MRAYLLPIVIALGLTQFQAFGQGVIGGPKPAGNSKNPPPGLVTALTTPGYQFNLVRNGATLLQVVVDPKQPIVVPLSSNSAVTTPIVPVPPVRPLPGFWSTFSLFNNTLVDRVFEFPWQYWATNKIIFRVYDDTNEIIWESVPIPVDPPPLSHSESLTLKSKGTWSLTAFIPLYFDGALLANGQYRLEAAITGTPTFSANASFEVRNIFSGPIMVPVPVSAK